MEELKTLDGDLTGAKAYRALLAMAFEHKAYFGLAIIGMVVFAASDAAFLARDTQRRRR